MAPQAVFAGNPPTHLVIVDVVAVAQQPAWRRVVGERLHRRNRPRWCESTTNTVHPELPEFTVNARRTPERVRGRHVDNQSPQLRIERWASSAVAVPRTFDRGYGDEGALRGSASAIAPAGPCSRVRGRGVRSTPRRSRVRPTRLRSTTDKFWRQRFGRINAGWNSGERQGHPCWMPRSCTGYSGLDQPTTICPVIFGWSE